MEFEIKISVCLLFYCKFFEWCLTNMADTRYLSALVFSYMYLEELCRLELYSGPRAQFFPNQCRSTKAGKLHVYFFRYSIGK